MKFALVPYPTYKDSGIPWLGEVPEHWSGRRLRNTAEMRVSNVDKLTNDGEHSVLLCNYVDVYKNDRITDRISFMRATATSDEIERFRLKIGDLLITKDSEAWNDIGVPSLVEYSAPDLVCGYHLALLRPHGKLLLGSYGLYALRIPGIAYQFYVRANGVTRFGLSQNSIKDVIIPVPPLAEQTAIVRFLDYMDRRIRRYVSAKKKLIKLLEEQKKVIIHRAVTRGLDPDVLLKPSGVEWLGEVPEHWSVVPNRATFDEVIDCDHPDEDMLSVTIAKGILPQRALLSNTSKKDSSNQDKSAYKLVQPGDLAYNKMRAWQGAIGISGFRGIISPAYVVMRLRGASNSQYFHYLFRIPQFAKEAERWSYGITSDMWSLRPEDFKLIYSCIPPLAEQATIVRFLDNATANIDATISRTKQEISLLNEYRTRLIADVVTGKLDVREAATRLPDEQIESELLDEENTPMVDDEFESSERDLDGELEEVET